MQAMFIDSYIYDGADNNEDNYIMCAVFGIANTTMEIKLTYGDETLEIGYVEVNNPIDAPQEKRKRIREQMEQLVGKRFNYTTLTTKLETIFGESISLVCDGYEDREHQPDWNFIFATNKDADTNGVFDIYYLNQRVKDENGNNLYVTEVACDFGA